MIIMYNYVDKFKRWMNDSLNRFYRCLYDVCSILLSMDTKLSHFTSQLILRLKDWCNSLHFVFIYIIICLYKSWMFQFVTKLLFGVAVVGGETRHPFQSNPIFLAYSHTCRYMYASCVLYHYNYYVLVQSRNWDWGAKVPCGC